MSDGENGKNDGADVFWPYPQNGAGVNSESSSSDSEDNNSAAVSGGNNKPDEDSADIADMDHQHIPPQSHARKGISLGEPKNRLKRITKENCREYFATCNFDNDLSTPSRTNRDTRISSNYVGMPYQDTVHGKSPNLRWTLIITSLEYLAEHMSDSEHLEEAILKYNESYKYKWDFSALHHFYKSLNRTDQNEFNDTVKKMTRLAVDLKRLCPEAIPFLKIGKLMSLTLSQQQVASLLANAFFCTFPMRNVDPEKGRKKDGGLPLPTINFSGLFKEPRGGNTETQFNKLRCIMHYFARVTSKNPEGTVTYRRQNLLLKEKESSFWSNSRKTFTKLHVTSEGSIESEEGMLQVDFANKMVGGGVIGRGCVQEEIRFLISPELIAARLFTETLCDNECLIVTGCERFSNYEGYASTFKWKSDYMDKTPRDNHGRKLIQVVAMDAKKVHYFEDQFKSDFVIRELNKAYCGFRCDDHGDPKRPCAVATGNWGCGDFGGDKQLKSLIQLMAATEASRDVCYFTYGADELAGQIHRVHTFFQDCRLSVGDVFKMINEYVGYMRRHKGISLYDYILKTYSSKPLMGSGTPV